MFLKMCFMSTLMKPTGRNVFIVVQQWSTGVLTSLVFSSSPQSPCKELKLCRKPPRSPSWGRRRVCVCCLLPASRAYYQSSDSSVRNCPLTTNTDTRSQQPLSSPAPSVSAAIGHNKLLIIGQGLSWQGGFSMRFVISSSQPADSTQRTGRLRSKLSALGNERPLFYLRAVSPPRSSNLRVCWCMALNGGLIFLIFE